MDNCNKIRDVILTDFLDDQLDNVSKQRLDSHLNDCSACRAFAQEVKQNLSMSFEKASVQEVPAQLWQNIQEKIQKEQYSNQNLLDIIKQFLERFSTVRLMPALGSLILVFFVGSTLLINQQLKSGQSKDLNSNLMEMYASTSMYYSQVEHNQSSTAIEKYFL